MALDFNNIADEFIAKVRSVKLSPSTEVNAVYYCIDEHGRPVHAFRNNLTAHISVKGPLGMQFAEGLQRDTVIGNINSLIRTATQERFCVPRDAPRIVMTLDRLELEIVNPEE